MSELETDAQQRAEIQRLNAHIVKLDAEIARLRSERSQARSALADAYEDLGAIAEIVDVRPRARAQGFRLKPSRPHSSSK